MTPIYITKLDFALKTININFQKIDNLFIKI